MKILKRARQRGGFTLIELIVFCYFISYIIAGGVAGIVLLLIAVARHLIAPGPMVAEFSGVAALLGAVAGWGIAYGLFNMTGALLPQLADHWRAVWQRIIISLVFCAVLIAPPVIVFKAAGSFTNQYRHLRHAQ